MKEKIRLNRIKDATVAIAGLHPNSPQKPFTIFGSGFCIDQSGLVVTCRHVLAGFFEGKLKQDMLEGRQPKEPPSRLIRPHAIFFQTVSPTQLHAVLCPLDLMMTMMNFDLALIRLPMHESFSGGFPTVEIEDYANLSEGDEIATCGFPLGNYLYDQIGTVSSSFTRGIISSIIPAQGTGIEYLKGFQLDLTATHGNSDGPVFSLENQKVFGVLQRGVEDRAGGLVHGIVEAEPVYPILTPQELTLVKNAPPGQLPLFPK